MAKIENILRGLVLSAVVAAAGNAAALDVTCTPGTLSGLVENPAAVTSLSVSGSVNAADLYFIADEMPQLQTLTLTATLTRYEGELLHNYRSYAATLPDEVFAGSKLTKVTLGAAVSAMGTGAFAGCEELTAVITGGAAVGDYAFMGCTALSSVDITGTTALPEGAFLGCTALTAVSGTEALTSIDARAFEGCTSLTTMTMGSALSSVGERCFAESGLTSIDLSICKSLKTLAPRSFSGCTSLESAYLPNGMTEVGEGAFFGCSKLTLVSFPAVDIANYTFKGAPLTNTENLIPDGVVNIGDYALMDVTGVSEMTIPNSVEYIGDGAMEGMTALTTLQGGALDHVPVLGEDVWSGVSCSDVTLYLDPDISSEFIATPQWQDFHVVALSTTEPTITTTTTLSARFNGMTLELRATNGDIGQVDLYDVNGMLLTRAYINSDMGRIDTSAFTADIYIVAAESNDGTRAALKLLR